MGATMVLEAREKKLSGTKRLNIIITGVGGQGIITLATLIARAALLSGTKALVAETHGLSQRGGSVEVHVRLGAVEAPLIPRGEADVLLGLELIETTRRLDYVKTNGVILTSDVIMKPALPGVKLPGRDELIEELQSANRILVVVVPATSMASEVGGLLFVNTMMLGALAASGLLEGLVDPGKLERLVRGLRRGEENYRAYRLGFEYYSGLHRLPKT
ncbi:MAG: indolepyruvate oxidoreductase subunit beta [Desulfurococcales archaeon]|nr:indolepyruvate oxidoreductase subunit beta [Desulfurococcales archaeon]